MARITPTVKQDGILYQEHEPLLMVDSEAWFIWLKSAPNFAFHSSQGNFTARRERANNKRGSWYWKAYSRRDGKLRHAYLGKSETLTLEHLHAIAYELSSEPETVSTTKEQSPFVHKGGELQHVQMLDLIGRKQETETACSLLQQPEVRLLTITGPGGVGKTRLALHVAQVLAKQFIDGFFCISLAPITDSSLVLVAIAQEFGFARAGDESLFSRLANFLREKQLLLVLDNFEQVVGAASLLLELASACPSLKIIVTSREILHLRIEHELNLLPLALPELHHLPPLEQISQYPALDLFTQRARAAQPDFRLTPANIHTVAEICIRLDGLPLALELGAARCKLLSPNALLARLDHRLQVLTQGPRDLPRRQQTLRDTISWSYELLDDQEQWIFRLLSVFVGGCTLEEAEQFCESFQREILKLKRNSSNLFDNLTSTENLEKIASLVDKNLLQRSESPTGEVDITMLETIREYGLECLATRGEEAQAQQTHALYYLSVAEEAAAAIRTGQQATWLNRLERDYLNLHAALHWLDTQKWYADALRLYTALCPFWLIRARQAEGYHWSERILSESAHEEIDPEIQAKAYYALGILADNQGQYQRAHELWKESFTLYTQINNHAGIVASLNRLGHAQSRNAPASAHELYHQSLALAREWEDLYGIADALTSLANEASESRDFVRARTLFQEGLDLYTTLHDIRSRAYCLGGLGQVAASESKYEEAYTLLTECLALYRTIGDRINIALNLVPLGMVTLYLGDYSAAHTLFDESLAVSKALGTQNEVANYLVQYPQSEPKKGESNTRSPRAFQTQKAYVTKPKMSSGFALGTLDEIALEQYGEQDSARTLLGESLTIFRETGNEDGIASKLFALGALELERGNLSLARRLLDECETLFRTLENQAMRASTLQLLGHLEAHKCNFALSHKFMQESVNITRQIGDYLALSPRLTYLGLTMLNEEKITEARPLLQESLTLARESGDSRYIADALSVMGLLLLQERNYETAQVYLEESRVISERREDRACLAYCLADLGMVAIWQNDPQRARPLIEEALSICMEMGNRWFVASCLERLGEIEASASQFYRATELWGCAAAIRERIAAPMPTIERAAYKQAITLVQTALPEKSFQTAWQNGYLKQPEQVLSLPEKTPLQETKERDISSMFAFPPKIVGKLTGRESEILLLVARGLTNSQIAEQLVISPRTVQTHLSSIYSKIQVSSRSAATRYALENHLEY